MKSNKKSNKHIRILLLTALCLLLALVMSTASVFAATVTDEAGNKATISGTQAAGKVLRVRATGVNQGLYQDDPALIDPEIPDGEVLYLPVKVSWKGAYGSGGSADLSPQVRYAGVTVPYVGKCKFTIYFQQYTLQTLATEQNMLTGQAEGPDGEPVLEENDAARAWVPSPSGTIKLKKTLTIKGSVCYNAGKGKLSNGKSTRIKYYKNGAKLTKRPLPSSKKYYFTGWYTKKNGGRLITKKSRIKFGKKKTITYYAHWEKRGFKTPVIKYKGKNATRIPVITYHRLASSAEKRRYGSAYSSLFVVDKTFNKQMKWLHDHHYYTLSTEEFYLWHQGKIKLPKKSVLITFDDGMYSIIKYGLPTLKKYNMKATMFMIGNAVGKKTNRNPLPNGAYHTTGKDVIDQVTRTYPDFEFQSHTWGMHVRGAGGNGYARTKSYAYQKADFKKMYKKFGYEFLAYPFGHYTSRTIKAAKAGHIKMAFTYGANGYATRGQSKYTIRRIKIDGNESMYRFTRWF